MEHIISTGKDVEDVFPEFNLFTDVKIGHMVAINTNNEDRESCIPFFLGGSGNDHHIIESSSENKTSAVEKVVAPKEISIPKAMTFHLLHHMANQSEEINDEYLESDRHVLEENALE